VAGSTGLARVQMLSPPAPQALQCMPEPQPPPEEEHASPTCAAAAGCASTKKKSTAPEKKSASWGRGRDRDRARAGAIDGIGDELSWQSVDGNGSEDEEMEEEALVVVAWLVW